MRNAGLIDTLFALIVVYTAFHLPLAIWIIQPAVSRLPQGDHRSRLRRRGRAVSDLLERDPAALAAVGRHRGGLLHDLRLERVLLLADPHHEQGADLPRARELVQYLLAGPKWGTIAATSLLAVLPIIVLCVLLRRPPGRRAGLGRRPLTAVVWSGLRARTAPPGRLPAGATARLRRHAHSASTWACRCPVTSRMRWMVSPGCASERTTNVGLSVSARSMSTVPSWGAGLGVVPPKLRVSASPSTSAAWATSWTSWPGRTLMSRRPGGGWVTGGWLASSKLSSCQLEASPEIVLESGYPAGLREQPDGARPMLQSGQGSSLGAIARPSEAGGHVGPAGIVVHLVEPAAPATPGGFVGASEPGGKEVLESKDGESPSETNAPAASETGGSAGAGPWTMLLHEPATGLVLPEVGLVEGNRHTGGAEALVGDAPGLVAVHDDADVRPVRGDVVRVGVVLVQGRCGDGPSRRPFRLVSSHAGVSSALLLNRSERGGDGCWCRPRSAAATAGRVRRRASSP